jgi:hypothetical protein
LGHLDLLIGILWRSAVCSAFSASVSKLFGRVSGVIRVRVLRTGP